MSATVFGGDSADSYYDEGLTASIRGDVTQAAEYFEKAIRLDNSMSSAYHQLGKCYTRLGRHDEAVKLIGQVVKQRPEMAAARLDLGYAMLELGNLDDARKQFQQVLATEPTNVRALLGMAQADFYEGNWQGAVSYAQTAHVNHESNFAVLYMLGRSAKLAGDTDLAKRTLQKADTAMEKYLEINAEKPEGHFLRGEVNFVQDDFETALEHYHHAEQYAQEGRSYLAYGEQLTLLDILAKQGLCHQRLGDMERARQLGHRLGGMDPNYKLGKVLRDL